MSLITNNISGSSADGWKVAITGSVLVGNPGARPFPSMPGSDVSFFVSGSVGGKGTADTAVFGGDTVVSGSLTVGTGSIIITSNEINFLGGLAKIYSGSSGLTFSDSSGTKTLASLSTGGGSGTNFFTESALGVIYNSGSVAFTGARTGETITAASQKGSDVQFYFSGSTAGDASALFGGKVVTSGSITVKDGTGLLTITGGTSSRSEIIAAAGNLFLDSTGGDRVIVDTNLEIVGTDIYAGGGGVIAKNIFADIVSPSYPITIGGATSKTVVGGDLTITGNHISGSSGGNITLGSAGDVTVTGDLTVEGNDIKSSTATAISLAGTTVTAQGNLIVKGDLYISGTTTTIDSTVVEIQDPIIGLGFASGSVAAAAGDRGFIGGISGAGNNVALIWSNNSSSFVATRTTTAPGSSPVTVSSLLPVRASRLDVGGTSAYVTSSDAQTLELNGASGKGVRFTIGSSTPFAEFIDNGPIAQFGAVAGKNLIISGTNSVTINVGNSGAIIQRDGNQIGTIGGNSTNFNIVAATGVLTSSLLNTNAQLINFGGAATTINVGNSAGNVTFAGDIAVNGGDITTPAATFNLVNANATTVSVAGDATTLNIANGATTAQTMNLSTASTGSSTYNLATGATANTAIKTINLGTGGLAGSTTNVNIGSALGSGSTVVTGSFQNKGNTTLGDTTANTITFTGRAASSLLPSADVTYDLGSASFRWRNMYTGDLHLRNERGDWTIIEEAEYLSITNNLSGKRYKFVLEEI